MNDPLHAWLKKRKPTPPPAPADEWQQILLRVRQDRIDRKNRVWYYVSAVTLSAAGLLALVHSSTPPRDADTRLDVEDVYYHEKNEGPESGAYRDWLWLADSVAADDGE